jgi:hypothetical protein
MKATALLIGLACAFPAAAQDVVPWKTFAQDQKQVKIQGFMMPLEMGEQQSLFVLSAVPPTCSFCMPGGPETVVEVRAKRPVAYTEAAVTVSGKLSVLKAEPSGIFYRLTEAVPGIAMARRWRRGEGTLALAACAIFATS